MRSLTTVCATRSETVGTPSFRVPPDALGISTCFTGGGKYDPDDIRFHSLYRFFDRSCSKSAMVSSSTPAAPRLAFDLLVCLPYRALRYAIRFRRSHAAHPRRLTALVGRITPPLRSTSHYRASSLLREAPPLVPASVFFLVVLATCHFPLHLEQGSHVPYQSLY